MGTDSFDHLLAPQLFSFEFVIDKVTIYQGYHQNVSPASRYVIIEEVSGTDIAEKKIFTLVTDGKRKPKGRGKKAKSKRGKRKKVDKNKQKIDKGEDVTEKKAPMVTRKRIFLPPFRIGLRFFFGRTVMMDQVDLPSLFLEGVSTRNDLPLLMDTIPVYNLALDKAKKGKKKVPKGKKKGTKGKKKKKTNKKVKQNVKLPVIQREPSVQWVAEDEYSPEELSWRLPSEETFKRSVSVTFPATAQQIILWLQRGPFHLEVNRWKGYGEEIPIGTAKLNFDPNPFINMVLNKSQRSEVGTMSLRAEDMADIMDSQAQQIGEISITFIMFCNGGTIISENPVSEKGLFDFLNEVASEKEGVICKSCGKFGSNYEYELMEDLNLAIVPNAELFDNSPFIQDHKYLEYAEALLDILSSPNPVSKFAQHLEKISENPISSEDAVV